MAKKAGKKIKETAGGKLADVWGYLLIRGIIAVALAVCALFWPSKTLGIMVKLLGAYFLFDGVAGAIGTLRSKQQGFGLIPVALSLALGLVLVFWTAVSGKLFLILIGVWLALQGITLWLGDREANEEETDRPIVTTVAVAMILVGLVFVFWTDTTIVALSWLLAIGLGLIGALLIFLATRLRRVGKRIDRIGQAIE